MKPLWQVLGTLALLGAAMGGAYLTGVNVNAQRTLVTSDEINTVEVTQKALQGVARIDVRLNRDAVQPGEEPVTTGTGFFYKNDRLVTNYHVVQSAESISVTLYNGRRVKATVEGIDPGIDIAILRVTGVKAPKVLSFGRSANLLPGQKVITIGTPLEFQNFVGTGVFSVWASGRNVKRTDGLGQELGQYMLTNANIQEGNSGGPIFDSHGAVIGVADANASASSFVPGIIGIAIPGDIVKQSLDDLENEGLPQRGTLGVTLTDLDSLDPALRSLAGLSSSEGALVDEVPAGTVGAQLGLRGSLRNSKDQLQILGDVILSVDGQVVRDNYDVIRLVAAKRPGQQVTLKLWRDKKPVTVSAILPQRKLQ